MYTAQRLGVEVAESDSTTGMYTAQRPSLEGAESGSTTGMCINDSAQKVLSLATHQAEAGHNDSVYKVLSQTLQRYCTERGLAHLLGRLVS